VYFAGTVEVTVMATFVRVGSKTKAIIRKQGFPTKAKTFLRLADAKKWARKVEAEIEGGLVDNSVLLRHYTLEDALKHYYKNCKRRNLKALRYVQAHSRLICRDLGHLTLSDVNIKSLEEYRDSRLETVSSATVKHELGIIKRALNEFCSSKSLRGYQAPVIRPPKICNARSRRLKHHELPAILKVINNPEVQALIQLAIETAMRRGELMRIEAQDIDYDRRTLKIDETKTNVPRTIPLTKKAVSILSYQTAGDLTGKLFSIKEDSLTQAFSRACAKAGIQNLRFHDLRHEATSRFFEMGLSLMEVASITGHQDPRMLRRYTHLEASDLLKKLDSRPAKHDGFIWQQNLPETGDLTGSSESYSH